MVKTKGDIEKVMEEGQSSDTEEENGSIFCLLESHNLFFLKQEIFLHLDHVSLHQARQVCQEWNMFIMDRVWASKRGKLEMEKKLERQWRKEEPHKNVSTLHVC